MLNPHTVMACKPSGSPAKSSGKPPGAMAGLGACLAVDFTDADKAQVPVPTR